MTPFIGQFWILIAKLSQCIAEATSVISTAKMTDQAKKVSGGYCLLSHDCQIALRSQGQG
ncbi:hypothetical protein SynROS8604_01973 [Synechococcus sp. ROS8604]|nr:hypothetical protein SynROS8604_01973 [Synechococcus sp. ROS8604]